MTQTTTKQFEYFDGFGTEMFFQIEVTMKDDKFYAWQHFDNGDSEFLGEFDTEAEAFDAEVY